MRSTSKTETLLLAAWCLFLVLVPFYLFGRTPVAHATGSFDAPGQPPKVEGGVPQIADFLMAGLMLLVMVSRRGVYLDPRLLPVLGAMAVFVGYVFLVNLGWTVVLDDSQFTLLKSSVFYLYDFLLLVTVVVLFSQMGLRFLRATLVGLFVSVVLQATLSLVVQTSSLRQALFFNNPNQLGYYSVLAASLFFLGTRHVPVAWQWQAIFYIAAAHLAILALSKAALFGMGLLVVLALIRRPGLMLAGATLLAGFFLFGEAVEGLGQRVGDRLFATDADDSLAKRGYDRIFEHPEYLLFGAGEGLHGRFLSAHPGELHSSWGTLLFCYGVIGVGLFAFSILRLCGSVHPLDALCLLPPFLYGLAHQGLRFTLFWVLLGCLCCVLRRATSPAAEPRDSVDELASPRREREAAKPLSPVVH